MLNDRPAGRRDLPLFVTGPIMKRLCTRDTWRRLRRENAQAAFEFLLVLPLFILFLLLLIDFGVMMYEFVSVSNAAREAARYGAVNCGTGSCTTTLVEQRALDHSGGILSNLSDVTVGWVDRNGDLVNDGRGDSVVVQINHQYTFLFFPASINVTSCTDMRLEQKDGTASLPSGSSC